MSARARLVRHPEGLAKGSGAVETAVFGLLGLLIAFTFSGSASRFEERRRLITEEANAIGTAYLRIDLLPAAAQPALRGLFREYLDARLDTYRKLTDIGAARTELARSITLQGAIWTHAVTACRDPGSPTAPMLLLPALNQMIDVTTTRLTAARDHPPLIIYLLLGALSLLAALLVGYAMAGTTTRSWLHVVAFAVVLSLVVYVIMDLEFPRLGLIRVDAADQILLELRRSMQ